MNQKHKISRVTDNSTDSEEDKFIFDNSLVNNTDGLESPHSPSKGLLPEIRTVIDHGNEEKKKAFGMPQYDVTFALILLPIERSLSAVFKVQECSTG